MPAVGQNAKTEDVTVTSKLDNNLARHLLHIFCQSGLLVMHNKLKHSLLVIQVGICNSPLHKFSFKTLSHTGEHKCFCTTESNLSSEKNKSRIIS